MTEVGDGAGELPLVALEQALLGGPRRYDRLEIAALTGVDDERAHALWRALGFAATEDNEKSFTDGDVTALRAARSLVEDGWLDEETVLAMTRALGQSLSRLADWQLSTLLSSGLESSSPDVAIDRAQRLVPVVEQLLVYVWRRQIAALGGRMLARDPKEMTARTMVVGFVDLVGYTTLTRHIDEHELARLIEQFDTVASDTVAELGGRVVKTVGDEVLFTADQVEAGAEIGIEITARIAAAEGLPDTRTGMATGTVLSRLGDVYGEPVNLAARLTSIARPGTVLVDRQLADALEPNPRYRLRRVPPRPVRGYSMLHPSRLSRAD